MIIDTRQIQNAEGLLPVWITSIVSNIVTHKRDSLGCILNHITDGSLRKVSAIVINTSQDSVPLHVSRWIHLIA